jgi:hypothetical protein
MDAGDIERKRLELEKKKFQAETRASKKGSEWLQKTSGFVKNNTSLASFLLIFGIITHIIHLSMGFKRSPWLISTYIIVAVLIVVFRSLEDKREIAKTGLIMAIVVGFEYFYYYSPMYTLWVSNPSVYWFLWKALWNGWIYLGVFLTLSAEKKPIIMQWISWIIIIFILFSVFNITRLSQKYAGPEIELPEGAIEESKKGFGDNLREFGFSLGCIVNADPDMCVIEKRWDYKRENEKAAVEAMEEICKTDIANCDCYVYVAGKERDDCFKRKSEAITKQISGAIKDTAAMKVSFEAPKSSESLSPVVRLDPVFKILSPNKAVNVELDCKIANRSGGIVASDFQKVMINDIKTDQTYEYSRRFSCKSLNEVDRGDYTFNLSASIIGIETKATFIGLYSHPDTIKSYTAGTSPGFKDLLEAEMKTAYPKGKVESSSDPDLTLLSFAIEPLASAGVKGLSGLDSRDFSDFVLLVSLKNNLAESKIKSVQSLEFKIPDIFTMMCTDSYSVVRSEQRYNIIAAKPEVLSRINFERIGSTSNTPIQDLNCELKANRELDNAGGVNPLDFEGVITYTQDLVQKFMVKRVG